MSEFIDVIIIGIGSVYRREVATFAIGTMTISLIMCLLDWIITKLFNTPSLLKVGYGGLRILQSFVAKSHEGREARSWPISALLLAGIATAMRARRALKSSQARASK